MTAAVTGQASEPTRGDLGTFLVQATDVKVRPFDEVPGSVRTGMLEQAEERYEQRLRRHRREADVTVSSRFGTWHRFKSDSDALAIAPPASDPPLRWPPAARLVTP